MAHWYSPRTVIESGIQGYLFVTFGGVASGAVAGVLGSVWPGTATWTDTQRLIFVVGLALGFFVIGVVVTAIAWAVVPPLRELMTRNATTSRGADAGGLSEILSGVTTMLDEHAKHLDRVDADAQRRIATAAAESEARVRAEHEVLSNRLHDAQLQAQDHVQRAEAAATDARAARESLDVASADLRSLKRQRERESSNREWAEALIAHEQPLVDNWLKVTSARCYTRFLHEQVGARLMIAVECRYSGVFPITVGETATGRPFLLESRMGSEPEVQPIVFTRGETKSLWVSQELQSESEKSALDDALATKGEIVIDCSHMYLSVTATLPDGTRISEQLRLPHDVKGLTNQ